MLQCVAVIALYVSDPLFKIFKIKNTLKRIFRHFRSVFYLEDSCQTIAQYTCHLFCSCPVHLMYLEKSPLMESNILTYFMCQKGFLQVPYVKTLPFLYC